MAKRIHICGVPVDLLSSEGAVKAAEGYMKDGRQHHIVTPNPEMVVRASRDQRFAEILKSADLALCDGFGLKLAALFLKQGSPEVVRGTDFAVGLAWLAAKSGVPMYLLGGQEDAAAKTGRKFKANFKDLIIAGAESGGTIRQKNGRWEQDQMLVSRVADSGAGILLVALGHGKQEKWIRDHLKRLPNVKVAVGVGGTFDYHSGRAKRPPKALRFMGLEWAWRLWHEPRRWRRILDAVVVFPFLVLKEKLKRGRVSANQ